MQIKKRDPQDLRMNRLWLGEHFQHHMDERGGLTPKYWNNASIMRWIPDPDTIPAPCEDTASPVPRPPESPGLHSEDYYSCDLAALRGGESTSSDDATDAAEAFIVD